MALKHRGVGRDGEDLWMGEVRERLVRGGFAARGLLALAAAPGTVGLAWEGGSLTVEGAAADVVTEATELDPRWVWWNARDTARPLVAAGVRPARCWDLGAVGMALGGLRRDDPAAVWAAAHGLVPPPPRADALDLFDVDPAGDGELRADGQLSPEWVVGGWSDSPERVRRWAELALDTARTQRDAVSALGPPAGRGGDHDSGHDSGRVRTLIAHAESVAALLAVELEHDGLPIDRDVLGDILRASIGDRPRDTDGEARLRRERDAAVLRRFPGEPQCDLRSPEQVRELLATVGLDVPDTRSWRLEPHAATSDAVAALLAWRKADRLATTYGWRWLDTSVGEDGRLRGPWFAADGGAGRMSAGAGLHNLPAELRPAVRAEAGHLILRADLGQIEPRVLAAVSGDDALIAATRDADMYAPVAARLGCDRPTAKVAVLAAMYGQTSGAAGEALRAMDRAYPRAMAYLRDAENAGRECREVRTYGGRLIRFGSPGPDEPQAVTAARGRYGRNAVVQGAAAELFKAWCATVRHGLRGLSAGIVLCLHDEIVLHVAEADVAAVVAVVRDSLAATGRWWCGSSGVRFVAEIGTGRSWADAH